MDYKEYIDQKLRELELGELEGILDDYGSIVPSLDTAQIIDNVLEGKAIFDSEVIVQSLWDLFIMEIKGSLILGVEIVTVSVIIGLLKSISESFGKKAISNMAIMVSGYLIIALCLVNFKDTYNLCGDTVDTMTHTMQLLVPVVIPLLVSIGGITSGSIMSPVMIGIITIFNTLMSKVILPAIFFSSIFILINSMTEKDYVKKLALFLRNASTFATGLCVTLFSGITVLQGIVTESADGLLVNTARFSINNFVPIVGGFAADSVDMILNCLKIIKNAVSIFGVVVIVTLLLVPLIKLIAIAVIYKLTAVLTEPIGAKKISDCLNEMGNSVITMAVILFLTAFMFLIFITVLIGIGGAEL